jgi:hypothetical protein
MASRTYFICLYYSISVVLSYSYRNFQWHSKSQASIQKQNSQFVLFNSYNFVSLQDKYGIIGLLNMREIFKQQIKEPEASSSLTAIDNYFRHLSTEAIPNKFTCSSSKMYLLNKSFPSSLKFNQARSLVVDCLPVDALTFSSQQQQQYKCKIFSSKERYQQEMKNRKVSKKFIVKT